jgi:NADPH-dependent 2,4-dienoyl-CoA reductase/sulfur reductase-like enzyme
MKIGIVGCGAAGGTAAQFAKKTNRKAQIIIYDKEGYGQYSKCALPYLLEGKPWKDIVEFPPEWFIEHDITYKHEEVSTIDIKNKTVEGTQTEEFDSLIIATGSQSVSPFENKGGYFLRNLDDIFTLKKALKRGDSVIIIGGGLVGIETAEILIKAGLHVTLMEYTSQLLPSMLDKDIADILLKQIGGNIILNCKVEKVVGNTAYVDTEHIADHVIIATGTKPYVPSSEGVISVDEKCKVTENIYAAGDCTRIKDFFGGYVTVGLGSIAARQGRVAGINAAGGNETMIPPVFSTTTNIFGMEIASVGPLSKNVKCITGKYVGKDLPHYMPGRDITIKILAHPDDGTILGCQAIGNGAAKIIDRITLAIYNRMTVKQIARIENAYAPLVAPTFDGIELACNMIERRLK